FLKTRLGAQWRQVCVSLENVAIGEPFSDRAGQRLERFIFLSEPRVSASEIEVSDTACIRARRDARGEGLLIAYNGFFVAPCVKSRGGELPERQAVGHARLDRACKQGNRLLVLSLTVFDLSDTGEDAGVVRAERLGFFISGGGLVEAVESRQRPAILNLRR